VRPTPDRRRTGRSSTCRLSRLLRITRGFKQQKALNREKDAVKDGQRRENLTTLLPMRDNRRHRTSLNTRLIVESNIASRFLAHREREVDPPSWTQTRRLPRNRVQYRDLPKPAHHQSYSPFSDLLVVILPVILQLYESCANDMTELANILVNLRSRHVLLAVLLVVSNTLAYTSHRARRRRPHHHPQSRLPSPPVSSPP